MSKLDKESDSASTIHVAPVERPATGSRVPVCLPPGPGAAHQRVSAHLQQEYRCEMKGYSTVSDFRSFLKVIQSCLYTLCKGSQLFTGRKEENIQVTSQNKTKCGCIKTPT